MLNEFQNFILVNSLINNEDKILLSVSGGRDSVTLCDLFYQSNFKFAIAHCNYHLRGKESDRDEDFVKQLAQKYNAIIHVVQFDTNAFAEQNQISIEMAARQLRYDWYLNLCNKYNYTKIATAHHLNDQIETFFINLMRTTGIYGIRGIPIKRPLNDFVDNQCFIIRPLLFLSRKEINEYIEKNNLNYVDDSTNFSDKIFRNFIRINIIPKIEEIAPEFPETLQKSITQFNCATKLLNKLVDNNYPKTVDYHGNIKVIIPDNLSHDELYGYLYISLNNYGYNLAQLNEISKSIRSTGSVFYSKNYQLLVDRKFLIIRKIQRNALNKNIQVEDSSKSYYIEKNTSEIFTPFHITFAVLPISKIKSLKCDKNTALIDYDKLIFPLEISTKKEGDYFFPLGMKKKKKLSDFYIDEKFDLFTKSTTFALRSNSQIIWIIGHRIDDRFKITDKTQFVYLIKKI